MRNGEDMKHLEKRILRVLIIPIFLFTTWFAAGISPDEQASQEPEKLASEKPATPETPPVIQFDNLEHDFGQTQQKAKLTHAFTFKNMGQGMLIIEKVKAG